MKYKYIIYKIYSWTANKKGDTPIANTIITLGLVHFFHFATLLLYIDQLFGSLPPYLKFYQANKGVLLVGTFVYFTLLYFILYNKERWNGYVIEFGSESESERKKGNRRVIAFLVGSILFFFISLPIAFTLNKQIYGPSTGHSRSN